MNNNQINPSFPEAKFPANPAPSSLHPAARSGINWSYQFQQYGTAVAIAAILFIIFSFYLFLRRGYYDLYIINKIFAGVGAIMLGLVLLLGMLCRLFKTFDKYLQYRKELGIVAFFLIMAHVISSYFFLTDKFPRERFFTTGWWPFIFGLTGSILLLIIFFISNEWARRKLGNQRWWPMQYWGVRLIFAFTVLHVFVMKYSGWLSWYQKGGGKELMHPEWPGAGLIVGWFMAFVVVNRLAEAVNSKLGKAAWYFSVVAFPLVIIFTFWWGQGLLK